MSLILGIQSGHESSVVLFRDGKLLAAISEERLTRIKNDGGRMPERSIDYVLSMDERQRSDLDAVALQYTFYPEKYFLRESLSKELERRLLRVKRKLRGKEESLLMAGNFREKLARMGKTFERHFRQQAFLSGEGFSRASLHFFDHHEAHALPAAYYSGFDRAAVITMDGCGDENIYYTASVWRHHALERRHLCQMQGASAGLFYSHITQLLGFQPLRHEGKIIGLAAYGDPKPLYDRFLKALRPTPDGAGLTSDFVGQEDAEAKRIDYLRQAIQGYSREEVSAAAQQVLEDVVLTLVKNFLVESGMDCVALNGGVFANVKLNQRIAALPEVNSVFVFPAMSDTGNSIGAVLLDMQAHHPKDFAASHQALESVYWGPEFTPEAIEAELRQQRLSYRRLDEETLARTAAQAIHDGAVVGWFQGRMEFGPRALGNRSMLARPTKADINDWLNRRLERSEFMPFAPSVLEEHADALFDHVTKARHTAEFMTITFDVKPEWRERLSAVVHVDGTARPQLVSRRTNPAYHRLISAYYDLSGIPAVLNTSFNVHEEPIVCAPPEAVRAFIEKRVDCLAIGPFWLERLFSSDRHE